MSDGGRMSLFHESLSKRSVAERMLQLAQTVEEGTHEQIYVTDQKHRIAISYNFIQSSAIALSQAAAH